MMPGTMGLTKMNKTKMLYECSEIGYHTLLRKAQDQGMFYKVEDI